MANTISILIQAKDNASSTIKGVGDNIESASTRAQTGAKKLEGYRDNLDKLTPVAIASGAALVGIGVGVKSSIDAANRFQSAMTGLTSIAEAFNQDAGKAKQAARELASDGLMTVGEAASGLKNLLAAGFGLDESVKLMDRFKDSAAFGRQGALGFGEAIVGATEGVKNGNSILVDNAGVTKNLSLMLQEAGFSAQDLSRASSDASVRQAIFNGILKETKPMLGDAARLSQQFAGEQARMSAAIETTKQQLGAALQPALSAVMSAITPVISAIGSWVQRNPELTASILTVVTVVTALGAAIGIASAAMTVLIPLMAVAMGPVGLLVVGVGLLAGAFVGLQLRANSATGAVNGHRSALGSLTAAKRDAIMAANSLRDAELGLEQANLRVERATRTHAEAVRMYGADSLEAREAAASLKQAEYDLASANDRAKQATDANKQAQQELASQKEAVAAAESRKQGAFALTADQIRRQNDEAAGLTGTLNSLNGRTFNFNVVGRYSNEGDAKPGNGQGYGVLKNKNATGTIYSPGGRTLVGENGPEIVNLPRGSQVTQAYRTRSELAGEGAGSVTNVLSGNFTFQTAESVEAFFKRLDKTQRLARMGMAS